MAIKESRLDTHMVYSCLLCMCVFLVYINYHAGMLAFSLTQLTLKKHDALLTPVLNFIWQ